jgi:amino acid adenylation domain-containing protein
MLSELCLLEPEQRSAWLQRSRGDATPEFREGVAAMILAQARNTPDRIAVAGTTFEHSYAKLVDRSLRLAQWLRTHTRNPEARVAVCLERGPELLPALLAVLMAGLVFVPVAPELPLARKRQLIARSRAQVLVSSTALATELNLEKIPSAIIGGHAWQGPRLADVAPVAAEQLAYLIFTSGSTGTPKGVAITQRSFAARMRWAASAYPHATMTGVLAASSVAFDLSIFELFAPLVTGGTVILARDSLELPNHSQRARVRLIDTVPSVIAALLRIDRLPPTVEYVNLAGEALDRELVARVLAEAPDRHVRNLYGPAEDTTFSTMADVTPGSGPASIGAPLPGTFAYLLDAERAPAPDGAIGELYLGGIGLARGYDHEPAATASRFVPDPLGRFGDRVFRTGDLARRAPDGALHFRGRRDRQIKLRGVRIEPGEIEATLSRCPNVLEVSVVPLPDARAPQRLVALVCCEAALDLDALRTVCARELPGTHQPQLLRVDALPRTSSGKLDLAAVTELAAAFELEPTAITPPASTTEALVHALWAELLDLDPARVSVDVDVFSLGAHSLLVASLLARLQTELDLRVPVRAVFEHRSVRGLAAWIDTAIAERDAELLELLERVECMSDEEVRRQLAELE